jgi:hypothetical protein
VILRKRRAHRPAASLKPARFLPMFLPVAAA